VSLIVSAATRQPKAYILTPHWRSILRSGWWLGTMRRLASWPEGDLVSDRCTANLESRFATSRDAKRLALVCEAFGSLAEQA